MPKPIKVFCKIDDLTGYLGWSRDKQRSLCKKIQLPFRTVMTYGYSATQVGRLMSVDGYVFNQDGTVSRA